MKLNNKIMLITYADSLGNDLNELKSVIDKYYAKAVGGIHILPFFPSSADRGFAPMRYDQVDARFGSFEDSKELSKNYYLMFDFMVNHISRSSTYFNDFKEKKEESEYKEILALGGMRQKHFEKNEVILSAGCTTHEIGLVLSGSVNIENLDLWGSKSILSNIGAGQVFGETYAFSHETLMVDAVAAQQTDILFWNLDILVHTPHPASTWQPKFIRNLLQISLRKNLALSQRIFCTTPKTIRGRLLVYLSNQAAKAGNNHFKIPFDRQGLADYLNVDRSALSKELGKMRDEGILTTRKNAFTLY